MEIANKQIRLKRKLERRLKTSLTDAEVVQLYAIYTKWMKSWEYRKFRWQLRISFIAWVIAGIGLVIDTFTSLDIGNPIVLLGCIIGIVTLVLWPGNFTNKWDKFCSRINREGQSRTEGDVRL